MKVRPFDYKDMQRQDVRLRAFKERNFDEQGYDNWIVPIVVAYFIAAGALLAASLLTYILWK